MVKIAKKSAKGGGVDAIESELKTGVKKRQAVSQALDSKLKPGGKGSCSCEKGRGKK